MQRRQLLVVGLCAAALPLVGCGALMAEYARQNAIARELDRYVIPTPLEEVWKSAKEVDDNYDTLFWHGVVWSDRGPFKMRTNSKTSRRDEGKEKHVEVTWFECEGESVGGGSRIHYFEVTEQMTTQNGQNMPLQKSRDRRTDLELALVDKFDKPGAHRIRVTGERAARAER